LLEETQVCGTRATLARRRRLVSTGGTVEEEQEAVEQAPHRNRRASDPYGPCHGTHIENATMDPTSSRRDCGFGGAEEGGIKGTARERRGTEASPDLT